MPRTMYVCVCDDHITYAFQDASNDNNINTTSHYVSCAVFGILCTLTHQLLRNFRMYVLLTHFTDDETKAWRD